VSDVLVSFNLFLTQIVDFKENATLFLTAVNPHFNIVLDRVGTHCTLIQFMNSVRWWPQLLRGDEVEAPSISFRLRKLCSTLWTKEEGHICENP
jgi:hypothetical protein